MIVSGHAVPDELVLAILDRHQVRFSYRNPHSARPRVVNPHAVCESSAGGVHLHAVQVGGPSSQGQAGLPGWRTFSIDLMTDLRVLPDVFEVDGDFKPDGLSCRRTLVDCLQSPSAR